jgi:predicted ribosome quality control (RQC) complex YloA/Tae2 family protein
MARGRGRGHDGPPEPRLYEHELEGGWVVLAGRTDEDNELLSTKLARANDYWFHVRGMPGSHVLLRAREGEEPSREILKQAAGIAAFYSKGRKGGVVPVSYTQARFVSKPRGARRGTVEIRREKVLKVRPALPPLEDVESVQRPSRSR